MRKKDKEVGSFLKQSLRIATHIDKDKKTEIKSELKAT